MKAYRPRILSPSLNF